MDFMHRLYLGTVMLMVATSFTATEAAPAKKAVAVVNFQNTSGSKALDYLKSALPESVSGSIAASPEIRVVERNALNKVLKEIELEQSGAIDTGQVARAGKLARADILLIGSFSGNPEKMTVTLKAVDVATGVVLEGRSVSAPLADIFEQCGETALAMASAVGGGQIGFVTITSNPEGAEVRIDGVLAGKTPLVEYKVSAGKHRVFIRKAKFKEDEQEITVAPGVIARLNESLVPMTKPVSFIVGLGYQRLIPSSSVLKQGNLITGQLGFAISKWAFDFTLGVAPSWDHSYNYSSSFGSLTDSRTFLAMMYLLGVTYSPFNFQYISPYVGFFGGFTRVSDYELKGSDNTSSLITTSDLFQLGGKIGFEIMPRQLFSLFVEGRYHYFAANASRLTKVGSGLVGDPTKMPGEANLSSFSFGGGVRLHF